MLDTQPRPQPQCFLREAHRAIEDFSCASTADEVMDVLERSLAPFGFAFFCFDAYPNPEVSAEAVSLANRVPGELHGAYVEERYAELNPAIRYCMRTDRPFRLADAPYDAEREPRAAEFMQRVKDLGLSEGLVFPVFNAERRLGCVWMTGDMRGAVESYMSVLHLVAVCAFDRISQLCEFAHRVHIPLTIRERDVLAWVARGKSAWEIGEILGIAKRTVDEHVQTACRKLNAVNRTQAVVTALRRGLINL